MSCCIFVHSHCPARQGSKKLTKTYPIVQTAPEIQRTSLVSAVLYLKSLPLNIDVLGFDYLDSPAVSASCCCTLQSMQHPALPTHMQRLLRSSFSLAERAGGGAARAALIPS